MKQIAALFVRSNSVYKTLPGVDCYDIERDARTWKGGCPAIAHPPCRTWGCLKACAKAPPHEHALGPWAVAQVRRWGGVVEHPLGSSLFIECGCTPPGGLPDEWGGRLFRVDQFRWGHRARKRTLLYVVGTDHLPAMPPCPAGKPTRVVSQPHGMRLGMPGWLPLIRKTDRESTPPAFAQWLVELARRCQATKGG